MLTAWGHRHIRFSGLLQAGGRGGQVRRSSVSPRTRGADDRDVRWKGKFEHLILPGSLDTFAWLKPTRRPSGRKNICEQVGQLKPNLCFIISRSDTAGHAYGSKSPEKIQALADCDVALKTIKDAIDDAGLTKNSVIILTADHGSHDIKDKDGKTARHARDAETSRRHHRRGSHWGKGVKKDSPSRPRSSNTTPPPRRSGC